MWPLVSLWGQWPWCGCLEPPDPSDTDATDEEVDAELLSLSNPQSDKREGDRVGPPIIPIIYGLYLSLAGVSSLTLDGPDED